MVFSQSTYIERSLATIKRSDFIARKMIDAQHTYLFPQPVNLRLLFLLVTFPSFSDRLNRFKSKNDCARYLYRFIPSETWKPSARSLQLKGGI